MIYEGKNVRDIHIAYVGGGSRGWAWNLMRDLTVAKDLSGDVRLYDIDFEAAKHNEQIGNAIRDTQWSYRACEGIGDALTGADFVIISILPGTFDEMESDVHSGEKYGVWQPVGDTSGIGGFVRAMRTVPMFEEIARAIEKYAPTAWVINYTNPMTVCVKTLYQTFPKIKAFGCCHEVFGTQALLAKALKELRGIEATRDEIRVNVTGINHFTWFTEAHYRDVDLFDLYREFAEKHYAEGFTEGGTGNWMNDFFSCAHRVKFDLFRKYGYLAAAGDRHLAEFMPNGDYRRDPEQVREWHYGLTPVSWRKENLLERLAESEALRSGKKEFEVKSSGEEGVDMIRALVGLTTLVTNVNMPNVGQITNLPIGSVVETNSVFSADSVVPVCAGDVPYTIYPFVRRCSDEMDETVDACMSRDLGRCFAAFEKNHMLDGVAPKDKKALFEEMIKNTAKYLTEYKARA